MVSPVKTGGIMKAYSNDLRERILSDSAAGYESDELAEKYRVSRSWVDRLKQRFRESGEIGARKAKETRPRVLAGHEERLLKLVAEKPDQTLNELRDALGLGVSRMAVWRTLQLLEVTVKKKSSTPPSKTAPTLRQPDKLGKRSKGSSNQTD
jgi:transposase